MGTGYGANVPDESGHGYNLTLYGVSDGGASSVIAGDPTGATRFDGTTTYGTAREELDFTDNGAFTLEAWTNDVGANEAVSSTAARAAVRRTFAGRRQSEAPSSSVRWERLEITPVATRESSMRWRFIGVRSAEQIQRHYAVGTAAQ